MNYRAAKQFILQKLREELSDHLYYHGLHHTLDVLKVAKELCSSERVGRHELTLVKTAALFHDAGFIKNKHAEHEAEGCKLVREYLPEFGYSAEDIEVICGMIMATKIPQSPSNRLEEIICDADLDYLGRDDFHKIANSLFKELMVYNILTDDKTWNRLQVSFLTSHRFFTKTNKQHRDPVKISFLNQIKEVVATYDQ